MKLVVLISCMFQEAFSMIKNSNIQTDVVIVNQCDVNKVEQITFKNSRGVDCLCLYVCTTERGLSNSRNMALSHSWGDICYICDDDEYLCDDFEEKILRAYSEYPVSDVITFSLTRKGYIYPRNSRRLGLKQILRTSSVQITFKREKVIDNNISFDPLMGSGSGNGGGEELKFLMDCKRSNFIMRYVPEVIASVVSENSQWFDGFTAKYFKDLAWSSRRILGTPLSIVHLFYWFLYRSNHYNIKLSKLTILNNMISGFFAKRTL